MQNNDEVYNILWNSENVKVTIYTHTQNIVFFLYTDLYLLYHKNVILWRLLHVTTSPGSPNFLTLTDEVILSH